MCLNEEFCKVFFQTNSFQNCILGLMIKLFGLLFLYHSYCYIFYCYFLFYDTTHQGLKTMLMLTSFPNDLFQRHLDVILTLYRGVCRTLKVSRMELFVTLINGFQLLTNVTVSSILFAVGVLDQHLLQLHNKNSNDLISNKLILTGTVFSFLFINQLEKYI